MKSEVGPLYSISQSLKRAAAECKTGTETLTKIEEIMAASFKVRVPDSHRGNNKPLKNAAGL